ncbi:hypothetical protein E4U59_006679, partial [Claviceps monticola]
MITPQDHRCSWPTVSAEQVRILTEKLATEDDRGGEGGRRVPGAQRPVHPERGGPGEGEEPEGSTSPGKSGPEREPR